jgi:hypothetical protein
MIIDRSNADDGAHEGHRPLPAANLVTREIMGETLIVPIRAGAADLNALYVLNPTAASLWRQLDGSRTGDDLVDILVDSFEVDHETARRDVDEFLASLRAAGLTATLGR